MKKITLYEPDLLSIAADLQDVYYYLNLECYKIYWDFAESKVVILKKRCAIVKMSSDEAELGLAEQLELAKYQVLLFTQVLCSSGSVLIRGEYMSKKI